MATQHGKNLIKITRFGFVNCYLVREDDGFTLVDTMIGGSKAIILKAAKEFGGSIVRIALTHAHGDHVGSVDALHEALPDAEVSIGARDVRFLTGDKSLDPGEPQVPVKGGYQLVKMRPNRLLQPGDRVGSLEVFASPGHTPGHISFRDTRDGTLVAGDAYSTIGGISTAGTPVLLFPIAPLVFWFQPTALASAKALLATHPTQLATGHGPVLANPESAMQHAIDVAQRRIDKASAKRST